MLAIRASSSPRDNYWRSSTTGEKPNDKSTVAPDDDAEVFGATRQ
jgi:hypothetical protein